MVLNVATYWLALPFISLVNNVSVIISNLVSKMVTQKKGNYLQASKAVVLLLLTFCLLLLPLWESVIVLCIVVRYFMSILALQSS